MSDRALNNPNLSEILMDQEEINIDNESFSVDSISKALWAGKKYLDAEKSVAAKKRQADEFKAKIDQWFLRSIREDENTMAFMKSHLWAYVSEVLSTQRRSKTVKLPGINLSMKKKPVKIGITDDNKAMAYCKENCPELVQTKESLKQGEIKKKLQKGEYFPGVSLIPGLEELYITADGYEPPTAF